MSHVAQAGLKVSMFPAQPYECSGLRHVPPYGDSLFSFAAAGSQWPRRRKAQSSFRITLKIASP